MVKKIASLIAMVLMVTSLALAVELPAPFERAKEIALAGAPAPEAPHVMMAEFSGTEDASGLDFHFVFFYNKEEDITAMLGTSSQLEFIAVRYLGGEAKAYQILTATPFGILPIDVPMEDAVEVAFSIFREAVRLGLI